MKMGIPFSALMIAMAQPAMLPAAEYEFSRYQVILDREPFGSAPAQPTAEEMLAAKMADAPPPFTRNLRVCAITETEEFGLRVGIVDIGAKPPTSFLMRVGEVQDGLELVDADFDREGALLKKDGEMYWMYLDGTSGSGPGGAQTTAAAPFPGAPRVAAPRSPAPAVPSSASSALAPRSPTSATSQASYAERLRKRREILEERRHQSEAHESVGSEALKKQLQEYQMELIRAGGELGPPLPMPLTKEMDDQLVSEGVLPPQGP
jgi:hypothetical protein